MGYIELLTKIKKEIICKLEKSDLYSKMYDAVLSGDREKAIQVATEAIKQELDPRQAIEEGFTPAIQKAGDLWEEGEYFLPELIQAAEAMKAGMEVLKPEMEKHSESAKCLGSVVIGTIEGDIHDIGKSLVATLLSTTGFTVFDLGVDVPSERFVREAVEKNASIIGISALLTTTMIGQKKVIDILNAERIRDRFKVLVGGAPISKKWAQEIGADAAPLSAMEAVQVARKIIK